MNAVWGALTLLAWVFQYGFYVPLVLLGRALKFALSFGLVGLLLVFIPIIGWAILLIWYFNARSRRQHAELMGAVTGQTPAPKASIWKPWVIRRDVSGEEPTASDVAR